MEKFIKNVDHRTVLSLPDQISYLPGQVATKTLAQNSGGSLTLFALEKGVEIGAHKSEGDVLVIIAEGTAKITIDKDEFLVKAGQSIVLSATVPHALYAEEQFKMLRIVMFS